MDATALAQVWGLPGTCLSSLLLSWLRPQVSGICSLPSLGYRGRGEDKLLGPVDLHHLIDVTVRGEDCFYGGGPPFKLTSSLSPIMEHQGLGNKGLEGEQE